MNNRNFPTNVKRTRLNKYELEIPFAVNNWRENDTLRLDNLLIQRDVLIGRF